MPAAKVFGVYKRYGRKIALANVSLTVRDNSISCLLGHADSGKTTLIRIIAGLLFPDAGSYEILGRGGSCSDAAVRRRMGFSPAYPVFNEKATVRRTLLMSAEMYGLNRSNSNVYDAADELCELFELDTRKKIGELAFAEKKKLSLASAMLHKPRLLLLDEPTLGLDSFETGILFKLLQELRHEGTSVLFTTSLVEEARKYSTHCVILSDGRVLSEGVTGEIEILNSLRVTAVVRGDPRELPKSLQISNYTVNGAAVSFNYSGKPNTLARAIADSKAVTFTVTQPDMEQVLIAAQIRGGADGATNGFYAI